MTDIWHAQATFHHTATQSFRRAIAEALHCARVIEANAANAGRVAKVKVMDGEDVEQIIEALERLRDAEWAELGDC